MDADEARRIGGVLRQRGDRQRRGVGGEDRARRRSAASARPVASAFTARSSNTASMTSGSRRARRSRRSAGCGRAAPPCRPRVMPAALATSLPARSARNAPCPSRPLPRSRSISTTSMPARARDIGDAGAHEAGADDADAFRLAWPARRPAGARPCRVPASRRRASGSSPPPRGSAAHARSSGFRPCSAASMGSCRPSNTDCSRKRAPGIVVVASPCGRARWPPARAGSRPARTLSAPPPADSPSRPTASSGFRPPRIMPRAVSTSAFARHRPGRRGFIGQRLLRRHGWSPSAGSPGRPGPPPCA